MALEELKEGDESARPQLLAAQDALLTESLSQTDTELSGAVCQLRRTANGRIARRYARRP